jgi:5-dehydro-2-deoxygluconokinase
MQENTKKYDILTMGRSSIDLYSNDIGSPFVDITSFGAFVGGSPLNIAVGCKRLGLNTAFLTAVGNDQVGKFILNFLDKEGINTSAIPTINTARSSAVILGIEPPDRFPLVYYRDNCADIQINLDHIRQADISQYRSVMFSGTAFSKDPSRTAMFYAIEEAKKHGAVTALDIDFRADQWFDPLAFGVTIRAALPYMDFVLGTEEEILAAFMTDPKQLEIKHQQISAPEIRGDIDNAIQEILRKGVKTLIVKRGAEGASIFRQGEKEVKVPGFPVEVVNVLGAGDSFAAGFMYGYLQGWDLFKAVRMANATGAIMVTKHGCANFMATLEEAMAFAESKGGL